MEEEHEEAPKQQTEKKVSVSANKQSKLKTKCKFVGVRQRPSGKWVAEIKDTTKKIRMWLGTFETAEEAARAYDEAAYLLRGSNTRTNFSTHVPSNSPLSLKIRNLLNHKKSLNLKQKKSPPPTPNSSLKSTSIAATTTRISSSSSFCSSNVQAFSDTSSANCNANSSSSLPCYKSQDIQAFDDAYRPDLSNCIGELQPAMFHLDQSWPFLAGFDQLPLTHEGMDLTKDIGNVAAAEAEAEVTEFERLKVERQISASIYAMNGGNEYVDNEYDGSDALWDLPTLSQLFCLG
ncbi:hypothetical protein ACE6H2_018744 [Prunus campanulata]